MLERMLCLLSFKTSNILYSIADLCIVQDAHTAHIFTWKCKLLHYVPHAIDTVSSLHAVSNFPAADLNQSTCLKQARHHFAAEAVYAEHSDPHKPVESRDFPCGVLVALSCPKMSLSRGAINAAPSAESLYERRQYSSPASLPTRTLTPGVVVPDQVVDAFRIL